MTIDLADSADSSDVASAVELADPIPVRNDLPKVGDSRTVESRRDTSVEIDLLEADDWRDLRSARLAALADSPGAFVTTLAFEEGRTPAEWKASLAWSTWAVARQSGVVVGIACLRAEHSDEPGARFIESVWVTPPQRRRGLVRRMLWRLELQARKEGAERLQLWVLETNDGAYDAYLKLDFNPVPDRDQNSTKAWSDGTTFVQERLMVKPLL